MTGDTLILAGGGTGGHVFPMVAVADALSAIAPELRLVFVGTERGIETRVVPERGYELELVRVLPIRGGGIRGALRGVGRAAASIPESRALVERLGPRAVFSIGGYAAGPVCVAAWSKGIPVALMEPNSETGLANRLAAPFVKRAYTAFPESERHFSRKVILRSGVPIRAGFEPCPYHRGKSALRVLVLGGSQGARALNEAVPEAVLRARTSVKVLHQTGRGNAQAVSDRYRALGIEDRVEVVQFIDDMPEALARAELVVGRSGASAVSEICAVGRPSLLVPYPHASGDHQRKNAASLERDGAAVCVGAEAATPERLAAEIDRLAEGSRLEAMAAVARGRGRPEAARTIAHDLLVLAGLAEGHVEHSAGSGASDDRAPLRMTEAV